MNESDLIEKIRLAFQDCEKPAQIGYDGPDGECVQYYFADKVWQDVSINSLMKARETAHFGDYTAYLSFMTLEGLAYFLPGYMTMCLRDDPAEIDFIMLSLYLKLTHPASPPPDEPGWGYDYKKERFEGLVKLLTPPQKESVAAFLHYQTTHWNHKEMPAGQINEEAERAYNGYWRQFDPAPPDPKTANAPTPAKP